MTVRELQRLLGADLSHCYWLIWSSRIAAVKVGGRWKVNRASAEDYARRRQARLQRRAERQRAREDRKAARAAEDARWKERLASVR